MKIYSLVEWQQTRQALQVYSHNKGQMIEDITNTSRVNASRRLVLNIIRFRYDATYNVTKRIWIQLLTASSSRSALRDNEDAC